VLGAVPEHEEDATDKVVVLDKFMALAMEETLLREARAAKKAMVKACHEGLEHPSITVPKFTAIQGYALGTFAKPFQSKYLKTGRVFGPADRAVFFALRYIGE
jgi:hypothetical protein